MCIPLHQKSETTAPQLENLKSKIARHRGLVWSSHLPKRYPAARRDMATPTPQHPNTPTPLPPPCSRKRAAYRPESTSPRRAHSAYSPKEMPGRSAPTQMQTTAELSELDVETVWPELVGSPSVGCGWVNAHSRWVRIPRDPLFT